MKKYLVIGNPIEHSLSPKLHNYWFEKNDIDANYERRKIDKSEIQKIINATSLGLNKEDNIGLNFKNINKKKLFYDVIYNPKETNFLRTGKHLGCQVSNGKMMFIYQALEAFKLWHKVEPEINEELKKLLDL